MANDTLLPSGSVMSLYIHGVFDSGKFVDTLRLQPSEYLAFAARVRAALTKRFPEAKWAQEGGSNVHATEDLSDYVPILNLSFVMAQYPQLLSQSALLFELSSGATCAVRFDTPAIYIHAFTGGVTSLRAALTWTGDWTLADVEECETLLYQALRPIVEPNLARLITAYGQAVDETHAPLYTPPFPSLAMPNSTGSLLYWTHRVYAIQTPPGLDPRDIAQHYTPLMLPIDQTGPQNQALKSDRFIYLGSGRSLIAAPLTLTDDAIYSYVRLVEIRNYLWKTLYDMDRGLRAALSLTRNVRSSNKARQLVSDLRNLDFRVTAILEELDPLKITFDTEKIWLTRQLDANWFTNDLIASLRARLSSFGDFYTYAEEASSRTQEERLRSVLNLIGVVATAGAVAQIIGYFDPNNHLTLWPRLALFGAATLAALLIYYTAFLIIQLSQRIDRGN